MCHSGRSATREKLVVSSIMLWNNHNKQSASSGSTGWVTRGQHTVRRQRPMRDKLLRSGNLGGGGQGCRTHRLLMVREHVPSLIFSFSTPLAMSSSCTPVPCLGMGTNEGWMKDCWPPTG